MKHLFFWYLGLAAAAGVASLTIAAIAYAKTRDRLRLRYLCFHTSLTVLVVLDSLLAYVDSNMPNVDPGLFEFLDYCESPLAVYGVMVTLPMFIHELYLVPKARKRNSIVAVLVGLSYVMYHLAAYVLPGAGPLGSVLAEVEDHPVFIALMVYGFATGAAYYRKLPSGPNRSAGRLFLILFGAFLPGIAQDKIGLTPMRFFPALYVCYSAVFSWMFIAGERGALLRDPDEPALSSDASSGSAAETIFRTYGVSPREREIVELALQGKSYSAIAKSLCISPHTVKAHVRNVYPKFGVNSRYELMALFRRGTVAKP